MWRFCEFKIVSLCNFLIKNLVIMNSNIRVRFAPSPTGPLHIGGLRTALFNYLFAKHHQGSFILRIEDTDKNRFVPGTEEYIKESLNWCNIPYDEGPDKEGAFGPYRQSERLNIYRDYIEILLKNNAAYYAFDTSDALKKLREEYEKKGEKFVYNWETRKNLLNSFTLTEEEILKKIEANEPYVVRFKIPEQEDLEINDLIRGSIKIKTKTLDDKIIFKSDGYPTYHLANVVDDHLMKISHVIRGEEWLPSLPLHILMYERFGWEAPEFAHLPLILKPVGKGKLSKRDGEKGGFPVFPINWKDPKSHETVKGYREDGYLPSAVVNMLAFLGWNPGTEQEIFSLNELIEKFELTKVNKAGAKFDPDKTKWYQQQHIQLEDNKVLTLKLNEILLSKNINSDLNIDAIVTSIKNRLVFPMDLWTYSSFYFNRPQTYDKKAVKKGWKEDTYNIMNEINLLLNKIYDFETLDLSIKIKEWCKGKELSLGRVMMPLRISLVGSLMGPDVFEIIAILGKEETIKRIEQASQKILL